MKGVRSLEMGRSSLLFDTAPAATTMRTAFGSAC